MGIIAEILQVPKEKLNWLDRKYFDSKHPVQEKDLCKVTVKNITPDEMLFLINNETLLN